MSVLVCVYCGEPRNDEWPVCCGETHFETEEEAAEHWGNQPESFEAFVTRMEAQQKESE